MPTNPEHDTRCTHCQRLLYSNELDRWACTPCEDRARDQLRALPGLYQQLGDKLAPTAVSDSNGKVSTTRIAPLPVALGPLDLLAPGGMAAKLAAIEDDWRSVLGRPAGPRRDRIRVFATWRSNPSSDVPMHTNFLIINLQWACERYEEVAYDLGVIRDLHDQAQGMVTGWRDPRVPIGCCPAVDKETGQACGTRLKVTPGALEIRCHVCGARWDRNEWLRLGAQMRGLPMPGHAA